MPIVQAGTTCQFHSEPNKKIKILIFKRDFTFNFWFFIAPNFVIAKLIFLIAIKNIYFFKIKLTNPHLRALYHSFHLWKLKQKLNLSTLIETSKNTFFFLSCSVTIMKHFYVALLKRVKFAKITHKDWLMYVFIVMVCYKFIWMYKYLIVSKISHFILSLYLSFSLSNALREKTFEYRLIHIV